MKKIILLITILTLIFSCKSTGMVNNPGSSNSLLGVVYDNKSNPIQGAIVEFSDGDIETENVTVTTDIDGKFYVPELPFNHYKVVVSANNCSPTNTSIDHFDNENVLIVKIASYNDLILYFQEHINSKNLELAQKKMVQLEEINKEDIYYNYLKSMYYIESGNYTDAESILISMIDKTEDAAYVNLLLADLYQYHLLDNSKAYLHLTRYLNKEYSEKEAQRVKELESVL